jgi:uncharacterized protein YggE
LLVITIWLTINGFRRVIWLSNEQCMGVWYLRLGLLLIIISAALAFQKLSSGRGSGGAVMLRKLGMAIVVAVSVSSTALAQTRSGARASQAPAEPGVTILHLTAEGSVSVAPDVLVADLTAQAVSPSAVEAQRKVNALMASGMTDVKTVSGVEARAVDYSVEMTDQPEPQAGHKARPSWRAQQTLELRSGESETLLDLVGKLQERGFAAASIDWHLSPVVSRKARDDAMEDALKTLRARAQRAAAALGLSVDYLKDVRVDIPNPVFPVRQMAVATMAARATPPPQVTPSVQTITSDVSAEIVLKP